MSHFSKTIPRLLLPLFLLVPLFFVSCSPAASPQLSADPGAVTVEGALSSTVLLANGDSTLYARIRIGTAARPERERGPINIALAIDTSGSMEGEAIAAARKASLQMIDALKDGDRLSVVLFHSKSEILLVSSELDSDIRAEVKKRISEIKAQGTTEMAGGLQAAIDQVLSNYDSKGINRVILLGDGIPNNASNIEYSARRAAQSGVAVTTLGLGLDYDETLMGKIADISGGRYQYIESADKLAVFFGQELDRINLVYGRNASAVITPGPGVRIESVVGGEKPSPGAPAYVQLGDITRGDSRDIVVRLTVTPRKAGVPIELLDTVITFDDTLEGSGRLERRVYLGAHTTLVELDAQKARNPEVELSAALAEASAITLKALELGKQGRYSTARDLLSQGSQAAQSQLKRTPSGELSKMAENMNAVASDMPKEDKVAPVQAPDNAQGYEFSDDAMPAQPAPASAMPPSSLESPSVVRKRKEVHQRAIDTLH